MKKHILIYSFFLFFQAYSYSQASIKSIQKYNQLSKEVLSHFKSDQKKKAAAEFLLQAMLNQGSAVPYWIDRNKKEVSMNEFQYDSFENAKTAFDMFSVRGGKQQIRYIRDIDQINAKFLIENIEYSFKVWEESPWFASYSFDDFCEYILPYRNSLEPLEKDWKEKYSVIYKSALHTASDTSDPVEVCSELIKSVEHINFIDKRPYPQPMLSIDQIRFRGSGNCTDIANAVLLLGRSLGLAITYDYTPFHAASSNSHYWNTILDKECNFIPFNGNGDLPYTYNATSKRIGKVLRQTFSAQKNALATIVPSEQIPTSKLRKANIKDVTEQYGATSDISYTFKKSIPNNIAYIAVFNKGEWKPLWWSMVDKSHKTVFTKMGRNIVYLPSATRDTLINNEKHAILQPEKYPILVKNNGDQLVLNPDFKKSFNALISRENEDKFGHKDFNTLELEDGTHYNLYYWSGSWKLFERKKSVNNSLSFNNLPKNALFRITPDDQDGFERIFTLDSSTSKIYWY